MLMEKQCLNQQTQKNEHIKNEKPNKSPNYTSSRITRLICHQPMLQFKTTCWFKGYEEMLHQSGAVGTVCIMENSDGTFTRILPFSASGDGSRPNMSALMLDRFNLSPKISVKYCAIFFCWGTLQWFSMDRMTGYLSDSQTHCYSDMWMNNTNDALS